MSPPPGEPENSEALLQILKEDADRALEVGTVYYPVAKPWLEAFKDWAEGDGQVNLLRQRASDEGHTGSSDVRRLARATEVA